MKLEVLVATVGQKDFSLVQRMNLGCDAVIANQCGQWCFSEKGPGTADGTSFCVITIDRENHVVYADCVGTGYDRNFPYTTDAPAYTNQIPISTDVDGGVYNGIGYLEGYRLGSGGTPSDQNGSYLTVLFPAKPAMWSI
jgi:hypothetical protein